MLDSIIEPQIVGGFGQANIVHTCTDRFHGSDAHSRVLCQPLGLDATFLGPLGVAHDIRVGSCLRHAELVHRVHPHLCRLQHRHSSPVLPRHVDVCRHHLSQRHRDIHLEDGKVRGDQVCFPTFIDRPRLAFHSKELVPFLSCYGCHRRPFIIKSP